jgi:hypothetical protein
MRPQQRVISRLVTLLVLGSLACAGCTHAQLRRSTVGQSTTLSDIYTQQVLNNLAMFIRNPDALPFFAFPNQGTTQIQDTGNIGNLGYVAPNFVSDPFSLNASRQVSENWVLEPIRDPAKLALMRCAYRQAIATCIGRNLNNDTTCPDCRALREDFYGAPGIAPGEGQKHPDQPCLDSPCWLVWGCKKHAYFPKQSPCHLVGSYCDLYVSVPPEGRDMLTRLTLAILDYAVNDPAQFAKRTKQVQVHLDAEGKPTTQANATTIITATIPIDRPSRHVVALDSVKAPAYIRFLELFGKQTFDGKPAALALLDKARQLSGPNMNATGYWVNLRLDREDLQKVWGDLLKPAQFVKEHGIRPEDIPSADLLEGRDIYEQKGSAAAGLQPLAQRLKAVYPQ